MSKNHSLILQYINEDGSKVYKLGGTTIIIHPCTSTPEESEQAERDMHMAIWAIAEALWEKGEEAN